VGVHINQTGGTFKYNTVAFNGSGTTTVMNTDLTGGVNCQQAATLQSSIIYNNTHHPLGGSQFAGTCTLSAVATGQDSIGGGGQIPSPAAFVSNSTPDVHLSAASAVNAACCIDKGTATGVSIDYDGETRPKGGGNDVGADEVQ
jgi:hypothetical protein